MAANRQKVETKKLTVSTLSSLYGSVCIKRFNGCGPGLLVESTAQFCDGIKTDRLEEKEKGAGICVDGILKVNIIDEFTVGEGVLIDGVLIKDGTVTGCTAVFDPADPVFHGTNTSTQNSGAGSITIGPNASTLGSTNGIAFGKDAISSDINTIAIGNGAMALDNGSTAVGTNAISSGTNFSTAIGHNTLASGNSSIAFGPNATATTSGAVAIGLDTTCSGSGSCAIGQGASATDIACIAIGQLSSASVDYGIAIGKGAIADAVDGIAFGRNANTNGIPGSLCLGSNAVCQAATHPLVININATSIGGAPGAATAGLQCRINGNDYIIPLVLDP